MSKHPNTRAERIKIREKKEAKRKQVRADYILKRKRIEELKLQETSDEIRQGLGSLYG